MRDILAIPAAKRSPAQTHAVFSYWRTTVPELEEANDKIEAIGTRHPEPATSQLVLQARTEMRDTRMLKRGDLLKPGKAVAPGVPAVLHPLPADAPPTRLTFARWLVDPKSPTTARAFVNRVWQTYFGTGLVATSEDFGTQSEAPSHPELLDWLAVEFMDNGWSMKDLHRLIVHSATYRQSSRIEPTTLERDPYNRLLARGAALPRRRRDRPRHRAGGQRPAEPEGRRPERHAARAGVPLPAAGQLRPSSSGTKRPAPTAIAARSTPSAGDRRRTRCCRPSTRRTATTACVRRAAIEHAAAGADPRSTRRSRWKRRAPSR